MEWIYRLRLTEERREQSGASEEVEVGNVTGGWGFAEVVEDELPAEAAAVASAVWIGVSVDGGWAENGGGLEILLTLQFLFGYSSLPWSGTFGCIFVTW